MAKPMQGVTSRQVKSTTYWYALIGRKRKYCGKDDLGRELAVLAREENTREARLRKVLNLGLREDAKRLKAEMAHFKTVTDMSNWFMELPSVQKQASYGSKISRCGHLLAYFGKFFIDQVNTENQERYRELRYKQGAASGTVNNEISLLRTMYHKAKKAKMIHSDSLPGEFVTVNEANPRRIITEDEFEALKEAAEGDFQDFLVCGYESAMRLGEIIDLRVNQVYLGVSHISGARVSYIDLGIFDTKNQTRRTVPVSAKLKLILERRIEGLDAEDYIFTFKGRLFYQNQVGKLLRECCEVTGIPYGDKTLDDKGARIGIVYHCLRHTRTTRWVAAGYSDEVVRRATGHRSLESYQAYIKLDPSVVMRLVESSTKTVQKSRESAL